MCISQSHTRRLRDIHTNSIVLLFGHGGPLTVATRRGRAHRVDQRTRAARERTLPSVRGLRLKILSALLPPRCRLLRCLGLITACFLAHDCSTVLCVPSPSGRAFDGASCRSGVVGASLSIASFFPDLSCRPGMATSMQNKRYRTEHHDSGCSF